MSEIKAKISEQKIIAKIIKPQGEGTQDHSQLTNLNWSTSGHSIDTDINLNNNDLNNIKTISFANDLPTATVASDDKILIQDTDNVDNLKTVTAQSIADLGGGGGGGAWELIDSDISVTSKSSVVFDSISSDYKILKIIGTMKGNTTGEDDNLLIQLNNDTSSSLYRTQADLSFSTSEFAFDENSASGILTNFIVEGSSSNITGGQSFEITFADYSSTNNRYKAVTILGGTTINSTGVLATVNSQGRYDSGVSASVISKIELFGEISTTITKTNLHLIGLK